MPLETTYSSDDLVAIETGLMHWLYGPFMSKFAMVVIFATPRRPAIAASWVS
jgi:hypothetical protein